MFINTFEKLNQYNTLDESRQNNRSLVNIRVNRLFEIERDLNNPARIYDGLGAKDVNLDELEISNGQAWALAPNAPYYFHSLERFNQEEIDTIIVGDFKPSVRLLKNGVIIISPHFIEEDISYFGGLLISYNYVNLEKNSIIGTLLFGEINEQS